MVSPQRTEAPNGEGVLVVRQGADGRWHWKYEEPGIDLELFSNNSFATREQAVASAREAYPDAALAGDVDGRHEGM